MVPVLQQTPGEGSNSFIFGRVATRRRNPFTSCEASLKLGGTYDVLE